MGRAASTIHAAADKSEHLFGWMVRRQDTLVAPAEEFGMPATAGLWCGGALPHRLTLTGFDSPTLD